MRFTKMEGIGNDYVYVNGFAERVDDPAALSVRMSRAHYGCGSDGLILILPGERAPFRMRMFNSDGSESGMCGNGIRCMARYCYDRGLTSQTDFDIETGGGLKHVWLCLENGEVTGVRVDMGAPELDGLLLPSTLAGAPVVGYPLEHEGTAYPVTLVNMGNPHAVLFVDDPERAPVEHVGPALERAPVFPERCNIEFVHVDSRARARMRVWERGTGETMACGTGACAAHVAGVLNGLLDRASVIELRGGQLRIEWREDDGHVYMTGPATFVYDGEWLQG